VSLTLDTAARLPALTSAESADLTTVVGNLVDNAIDACRSEASPEVVVDIRTDANHLVLEVHDNGPGVPEEMRDAIFVRGFSTKPEVLGGRGIGLPLVQLICTQRGGSVAVDHDHGTTFRVELPLSERPS